VDVVVIPAAAPWAPRLKNPTLPEGAEKTRGAPVAGTGARAQSANAGADPEIDAMADADDAHRAALARRAKSARREAPEAMVP
jgi:hypothetical protein